jgi:hypothetical protein
MISAVFGTPNLRALGACKGTEPPSSLRAIDLGGPVCESNLLCGNSFRALRGFDRGLADQLKSSGGAGPIYCFADAQGEAVTEIVTALIFLWAPAANAAPGGFCL